MGSRGRSGGIGSSGGADMAKVGVLGPSDGKPLSASLYPDSFWEGMIQEKMPRYYEAMIGDGNLTVRKQTEKAFLVDVDAGRIDGEYDITKSVWMPKSAFSTVSLGRNKVKFASEKSKTRALEDLARQQAKEAAVKKLGGSVTVKGKKGNWDILGQIQGPGVRSRFVANQAKAAGITGIKANSSAATVVKKAKEQGKFGEISNYFRASKNSPNGLAYNNAQIAATLSRDPKLAVKVKALPEDY